MKHLALIGDIVESRSLADRSAVQERFGKCCQQINQQRKHYAIVSPLMVTLGDEFQAVFKSSAQLWAMIARFELDMYPVGFRFSIGVGEITTRLNNKSPLGMDGPAFYNARAGVEQLRAGGGNYRVTGLGDLQKLTGHALDLWSAARAKWNYNRLATFTRILEGVSVPEIARELNVSEQAVYRTRRDGQLDTVIGLLKEISRLIDEELQS
ncbi:MAG: SatD family protein [Pseudohongiella sp.]|nr:SatD family protein [Pseudohongiella sp.]